jgi:hypothetical protein
MGPSRRGGYPQALGGGGDVPLGGWKPALSGGGANSIARGGASAG